MPYRAVQAAPVAPPGPELTLRRANVGLFTGEGKSHLLVLLQRSEGLFVVR